jgi:hypothetical protein
VRFQKKPVVVDAIQWTGSNNIEVFAFMSPADIPWTVTQGLGKVLEIRTLGNPEL